MNVSDFVTICPNPNSVNQLIDLLEIFAKRFEKLFLNIALTVVVKLRAKEFFFRYDH